MIRDIEQIQPGSELENKKLKRPTIMRSSMRSSRRYCWNTKAKANSTGLMDEDYSGSFYKTKKMAVNIEKTVDYADYYLDYYGYPYDDY